MEIIKSDKTKKVISNSTNKINTVNKINKIETKKEETKNEEINIKIKEPITTTKVSSTKKVYDVNANKVKSYGPNGFIVPSKEKIKDAMGITSAVPDKVRDYMTKNYNEDYDPIPIPRPGDWLWENKESYQTFKLFDSGIKNVPNKFKSVIYLKNMDVGLEGTLITDEVMDKFVQVMQLYYPTGVKVQVLKNKNNFENLKIKSRKNPWTDLLQYSGSDALTILLDIIPKDGFMILGITSFDIYNKEEQNFVFGLARSMSSTGLFSIQRYYEDLKYSIKDKDDLLLNAVKGAAGTMVHEVGHLFGIKHCVYFNCKMNGGSMFTETPSAPAYDFCPVCIRKLRSSLKFDIKDRLSNLAKGLSEIFGKSVGLSNEIAFFENRYNSI